MSFDDLLTRVQQQEITEHLVDDLGLGDIQSRYGEVPALIEGLLDAGAVGSTSRTPCTRGQAAAQLALCCCASQPGGRLLTAADAAACMINARTDLFSWARTPPIVWTEDHPCPGRPPPAPIRCSRRYN